MAVDQLYSGYGFQIETNDISSTTIGGLVSTQVTDNVNVERESTDADIYPSKTSLLNHDERFGAMSLNVDDVIDVVGVSGQCLRGTNLQKGIEYYLALRDQCTAGVNTGTVNLRMACKSTSGSTATFGQIIPTRLVAGHQQNAQMGFEVVGQAGSGVSAITVTDSVALPTIADNLNRFSLHELTIDGFSVTGKKNLDIAFNVQLLLESADGSLVPEWVAIENIASVITVTGINPKWALASNIPRGGKRFTHANCSFNLRKRSDTESTGWVPDATAEHITGTAAGKAFITTLANAQGTRTVENVLVMFVEFDKTNAPIVLNTSQTI